MRVVAWGLNVHSRFRPAHIGGPDRNWAFISQLPSCPSLGFRGAFSGFLSTLSESIKTESQGGRRWNVHLPIIEDFMQSSRTDFYSSLYRGGRWGAVRKEFLDLSCPPQRGHIFHGSAHLCTVKCEFQNPQLESPRSSQNKVLNKRSIIVLPIKTDPIQGLK